MRNRVVALLASMFFFPYAFTQSSSMSLKQLIGYYELDTTFLGCTDYNPTDGSSNPYLSKDVFTQLHEYCEMKENNGWEILSNLEKFRRSIINTRIECKPKPNMNIVENVNFQIRAQQGCGNLQTLRCTIVFVSKNSFLIKAIDSLVNDHVATELNKLSQNSLTLQFENEIKEALLKTITALLPKMIEEELKKIKE